MGEDVLKNKKKLAVLLSGGGSNFQSILDAIDGGEINASVCVVISSNSSAYGLERAKQKGIPAFVCSLKDYENREKRDEKIKELLVSFCADYVILAGYLGIVSPVILKAYPDKVLNIHPALLPAYGGDGMHGLNVHRAVIAARERYSGATVHFVDEGTDTGRIIAQDSVKVDEGETAESLQKKILENVEHRLYPKVIKKLCEDKIIIKNGKVKIL